MTDELKTILARLIVIALAFACAEYDTINTNQHFGLFGIIGLIMAMFAWLYFQYRKD